MEPLSLFLELTLSLRKSLFLEQVGFYDVFASVSIYINFTQIYRLLIREL